MRPLLILALLLAVPAGPAAAGDTRYLAYDAADRLTQALTRGVTLEVERSLFGSISVRRLISTSQRGSAEIRRGGPERVRDALPEGVTAPNIYSIAPVGDGRGLSRALCPGAEETWLAIGRVRLARPLELHAVGRWSDGTLRHCVRLAYNWRGEWSMPPAGPGLDEPPPPPTSR
ncbi:hypothetical protein [uncultured Brevundimonas sp.]|uniref:hypothetical protein n=1 Tax=uncultured Brevundimonas sp. TaxID=213418 RepID=UPI0030EC04C5|tara:strand:+ start:143 stop:664 length:522 start_codon:yes stop_codon:yes gene_type:complete